MTTKYHIFIGDRKQKQKDVENCSAFCFYNGDSFVILSQQSSIEDKIFNSGFCFITNIRVDRLKIGKFVFVQNKT